MSEEKHRKDIKERDSFVSRFKAKDESQILKIATPADSGVGELQVARRLNIKHTT